MLPQTPTFPSLYHAVPCTALHRSRLLTWAQFDSYPREDTRTHLARPRDSLGSHNQRKHAIGTYRAETKEVITTHGMHRMTLMRNVHFGDKMSYTGAQELF